MIGPTELILMVGVVMLLAAWLVVPLAILLQLVRQRKETESLKRSVERLERLLEKEKTRKDEAPE